MRIFGLLFCSICLWTCSEAQPAHGETSNAYTIIYEADSEGNAIAGDLKSLKVHIQNGNPIRIGWILEFPNPQTQELMVLEHWADAGFVTLLNGHVFAQINPIFQQGPNFGDPPQVYLLNNHPDGWVAIVGTTGTMRQKFKKSEAEQKMLIDSGMSEAEVKSYYKDMETSQVKTKWAAMHK